MQTNRDVYGSVEFDSWAGRADIEAAESHLLRTYLDPSATTLEAGTGGGRLLLGLAELGFSQLYGFDFVPEFVQAARKRDANGRLKLSAQDATRLGFADSSFDQIIYLQQVLSLIESEQGRRQAMAEAFRVLRPGGTALFSFLSHEVRSKALPYQVFSRYLQAFRWARGSRRGRQTWPWLRLGGKFNFASLRDSGPYVYWYRVDEALDDLRSARFTVEGIASRAEAESGRVCARAEDLLRELMKGALYCVCRKAARKTGTEKS